MKIGKGNAYKKITIDNELMNKIKSFNAKQNKCRIIMLRGNAWGVEKCI